MSGGAVRKYVHELDSKNATVQKTEKRVSHVKDLVEQFDSSASEKKSDKPEQNVNGQTAQIQPLSPKTSSSHNRQTAPVKPSVQLPTNLKAGVNPVKPVIPNSPLQSPKLPQFIPKSPPLCPNKPVKNLQVTKPTGYVKPQVHDKPQAHSNTSNLIQKDPTTETNKEIDKSEKLSADVDQSVSEEALVKPSSIASHENKNDTKPAGTSSPRLPKKPVSIKSGKCQNVTAPETESKNFENATENCATENCATENVVTDSTTVESTTTEIDESVTEVTSVDKDHVTENVVQYDDTRIYANSEVACAHENLNGTINGSSEEPLNRSFDEHVDETGNNANSKEIQRQISDMFDSSWSDSDFAEFSDSDNEECEDKPEEKKEKCVGECKLRKIANELQQTERAYVKKLVLVNETFQAKIKEENDQQKFFPPEVIPQMFSNIGSIRQFHELHFLPSLDKRMDKWEAEPKIGDLMKNNAPFLKMYTEYVKNFDHATNLISFWMEKSTKFAAVIKEIQKKPECCCLTLQHHMLEPIQRVPRYEMLLKDYIKHLPEDSDDLNDAKVALQKVTQAAQHSNEAMKKIEKFHKLLEIKEKIATTMDLISPTRELIREGRIKKISARGGERLDRYLFLFNDLLLICCEPLLGSYKIKAELEMDGLEIMERTDKTVRWILEGENMDIPNTFYVKSTQKIIQFLDENSAGETTGWSESIKTVIKEFRLRKQSIHGIENESACDSISETDIGKVAPRWIKDDEVTMCMSCTKQFTGIRRRHHCRACGKVVCGRCSGKKAALIYDNNRPNRVCDKCYGVLKHHSVNSDTVLKSKHTPKLLQKQANEPSVLSGYLHKSTDKGKTWCKRWISVCSDFVMYEFKAHQDVCALSCIPLPGYQVEVVESMENVFKITHQKQNIFFQPENTAGKERWTEVLRKIVNLQLPDEAKEESNRNSVQSTDSSSGGPDSSQNTDKQAEIE